MTDSDTHMEMNGKAPNTLLEADTLLEDVKDEKPVTDMSSKTEAHSEISDNTIPDSSPEKHPQSPKEEGSDAAKKQHPPPKKEYGIRWEWSSEAKDYINVINGITLRYKDYQRTGGVIPSKAQTVPPATAASATLSQVKGERQEGESSKNDPSSSTEIEDGYVNISHSEADQQGVAFSSRQNSISVPKPLPPPKKLKEYEEPLDEGFTIVDKPKRFFQVGRIFATVWFEPGGENPPGRKPDLEWTKDCPKYHDEKPIAKFRWFVVIRRRLHHSLCFNITTIGPKGPRKADRGRGQDFVVLHNSNVEPSKPFEVEGITRDPIAVIIEAGEESISPWARLDCGRLFTVEDNLRVMKIGRVHTASLPLLETYFKESVA